jgi:hypothetical protein
MTPDEIRVLLRFEDEPQAECGEVNALRDERIGHVAMHIGKLKQPEKQLEALRDQCGRVVDAANCGILKGLTRSASPTGVKSADAHVPGAHGSRCRSGRSSIHE